MKSTKKTIGIIGLGRFGSSIAKNLIAMGHEVIGVDISKECTHSLSDTLTHVVCTDSTKERALREIGLQNCDAVVVAIGSNVEASIMTTLIIKEMNIPTVVAKANDALHAKVLSKIGVEYVVQPESDMGERVSFHLISDSFLDIMQISPEICLVEIQAPRIFIGQSLDKIKLRDKHRVIIAAIKRNEQMLVPPLSSEIVQAGDVLFLFGNKKNIARLGEFD